MANEVGYMVDTRGHKPDLIRSVDGLYERYDPTVPGSWRRSRSLDSMAWGGGDFVWFDDISEERAKKYMKEIDEYWKKKKG